MALTCPNKNLKEWKDLLASVGENRAMLMWYESEGEVGYSLAAQTNIIDKLDKVNNWFKQMKDSDAFWSKLQKDLQIPKEQITLLRESEGNTIEKKLINFSTNYSYTVKINTAKLNEPRIDERDEDGYYTDGDFIEGKEGENTKYYSNLTVPGGTNYTENEISTPLITPSIKGHAQFATDNGIGWFRSDEQAIQLSAQDAATNNKGRLTPFDNDYGKIPTKTRRILEVQSDLFQKGRDKANLTEKDYSPEDWFIEEDFGFFNVTDSKTGQPINSFNTREEAQILIDKYRNKPENQFLQLLNKDSNWVTFFVKSIIQDTAKQTVTEVQESDVEAKVRQLEKEGLLEIDCKGKIKAEKGLQTNFTKGGKWKLIKDLKGYPTHKEGGVDLTIGKNGVSIKNGNTEFTAKHGLVIPKN